MPPRYMGRVSVERGGGDDDADDDEQENTEAETV
jgi:hypothetical protein